MAGLFYNLGKKLGPSVRKGKWLWHSFTGTEAEAIAAETAVGRDIAAGIIASCNGNRGTAEDQTRINTIGEKLTARVKDKRRQFDFNILPAKTPNAFALPGGYIFITDSLINLCRENDGQLAFIIAHEMAHVIKKHAIDRITTDTALRFLLKSQRTAAVLPPWLKKTGFDLLGASYSQQREFDADNLGTRLALAAGYQPDDLASSLENLAKSKNSTDITAIGKYFSTHPPIPERIQKIKRAAKK